METTRKHRWICSRAVFYWQLQTQLPIPLSVHRCVQFHVQALSSMDWFRGIFTRNHRFSHQLWGFPVKFPLNQSIDISITCSDNNLKSCGDRTLTPSSLVPGHFCSQRISRFAGKNPTSPVYCPTPLGIMIHHLPHV